MLKFSRAESAIIQGFALPLLLLLNFAASAATRKPGSSSFSLPALPLVTESGRFVSALWVRVLTPAICAVIKRRGHSR